MRTFTTQSAFSLVELAIVLVILGLLAGGVLSGQSLIRAAELRSVTTQADQYVVAIQTFRDKYFAIPGDMNNAISFWGSAGGNDADATCVAAQADSSKKTCNGDGDGQISGAGTVIYTERFMAWKHLANAGLVEGNYTGKSSASSVVVYKETPGSNVPKSKIGNGFFDVYFFAADNPYAFAKSNLARNYISLYGTQSGRAILKPEEAWNIDTKLDDGNPVYGSVVSRRKSAATGPDCTTADDETATYAITDSTIHCVLDFGGRI